MKLRSKILIPMLAKKKFDLLLCESQIDGYIFNKKLPFKTFYDVSTPWADELYFSGDLSQSQRKKFTNLEIRTYENASFLSFHWESYGAYVQNYYGYKKENIVIFNAGTEKKEAHALYAENPKIVYFGLLSGKWINMPLLEKLSKEYPIDVYGTPKPDKKYLLNYKGYASPNILSHYQFGLITITKDSLRMHGFSAKHLEYLSYGLPVLVPEWRKNARHIAGTIFYNETNFKDVLTQYSQEKEWLEIHSLALKQAEKLRWEKVLKILERILEEK